MLVRMLTITYFMARLNLFPRIIGYEKYLKKDNQAQIKWK